MTAPPRHLVSLPDILPWAAIINGYRSAGADPKVLDPEYRLRSLILAADMCSTAEPARAIWRMIRREFPNYVMERECTRPKCWSVAYYWPEWWSNGLPTDLLCPEHIARLVTERGWCPIHRVELGEERYCEYGQHGTQSTHFCEEPEYCRTCNVDTLLDFEWEKERLGR